MPGLTIGRRQLRRNTEQINEHRIQYGWTGYSHSNLSFSGRLKNTGGKPHPYVSLMKIFTKKKKKEIPLRLHGTKREQIPLMSATWHKQLFAMSRKFSTSEQQEIMVCPSTHILSSKRTQESSRIRSQTKGNLWHDY